MMDEKTRICEDCGKTFLGTPRKMLCPECRKKHKWMSNIYRPTSAAFRAYLRESAAREARDREARRARDFAYARWEKENGVSDRVRVSGNAVVVSRGYIPAGFRAVGKVAHT